MNRRGFLAVMGGIVASLFLPCLPVREVDCEVHDEDSYISELVESTLQDLGEMKFSEIANDLQKHVSLKRLLESKRIVFNVVANEEYS